DSSQMADTFVERFRSLGGQLETGDGVENIRVESGRVKGVTLASGRWLDTDTVIAAIHPVNVTTMLPDGTLKPEHTERIHRLENTKGLLVVTLAVDGKVHEALPYNLYRLYPEVDGSLSRGLFLQLRRSARPGTHLLTIMNNSDIQTWRPWVGTKSGHRGGNYELAKQERAGELIAEVSTFFGPLQGMRILDIYTPLSIRDWVGSPEGSAYGIMRSTGQLMKTAFLNRPGIDGLFFAGQNILAPGVMGTTVGSFQVVRRVIGRERFDREVLEKMR
ncbi:MAG: FAD-dependent oxidoreductase, partial [Syntrophaceae bacterium]|nr:FAD-dependent oxidoreductase [Syntrophaceae bacterium]